MGASRVCGGRLYATRSFGTSSKVARLTNYRSSIPGWLQRLRLR